ncbi:MAG: exodeoxyribonuclease V subunit gamma [Kofleriaceae bacterium]
MLRVVHSNRSAALAEALVDSLGPVPDPFAPAKVVVAGRLVERWLQRRLAERHGIAAGVSWMSFEALLVAAYTVEESGREPRLGAIDRSALPMVLSSVLARAARRDPEGPRDGAALLDPILGPVRSYLASDDPADVVRRVQLAERLADLYWSYGLSRPQWLLAWERRRALEEHRGEPAAAWQAELWARVIEHATATAAGRRGGRRGRWAIAPLLPALRREVGMRPPSVGKVSVIGFPYLTRAYLDGLSDLAMNSELTLYLVNPCQELWDDVGPGQLAHDPAPLVLWGRPIRDTVSALIERTGGDFEDRFVDPAASAPASAMAHLLGDVLRRETRSTAVEELSPEGAPPAEIGLTVLDCPSVRRELEVIGSEVLRLLAADPTLTANQIAILAAGRQAEATLIQAVAALQAVGPIPCHLIDAPLAESGRIVDGLLALLELPRSKMTRRDLLRVMTHPAVIARYPHADPEQWARWTERLGVAHGADASAHRQTYLEPHRELFHWDQGIRRLAMGAFMIGERGDRGPVQLGDRVLVPEELRAESHASAATFALMARSLIRDAAWMRDAQRPLAGWARALTALLDAYLEPADDAALHELDRCRRIVAQLAEHDLDGRVVDFLEVRELLLRRLGRLTVDRGEPLAAGVMVAPLSSFRPVAFRHVFITGLGDGEFPAAEGRHPLDLRRDSRLGDVSPRERDRHAFFDAVLAATDGIWLSYVGLHPQSGDRTGPSSVIIELADALAPYLGAASGAEALARVTATHPLHRFDPRYDGGGDVGGPPLTPSAAPATARERWAWRVREALVAHLRERGAAVPDEDRLLQVLAATGQPALARLAGDIGVVATTGDAARAEEAPAAPRGARTKAAAVRTVGLSTLRDFLEYPAQAWAHAVLGLDELEDELLLERSDEPFSVGAAERAVMLREVMAAHLRDPSVPLRELYEQQAAARRIRSRFPVGVFGRAVEHNDLEVLEVWRRALGPLEVTGERAVIRHGFGRAFAPHTSLHDAIEVTLELHGDREPVRLVGQTEMLVGRHGSVIFKAGKMAEREHLRGAFDNLVLAAAELSVDGHAHLIIDGDGASKRVAHAAWTTEEARAYLTALAQDLFGRPHGYLLSITQLRDALRGRTVRAARGTGNRRDDQRLLGYGPITRLDGLDQAPSVEELARRRLLPLVIRMQGDHPFPVES